MDYTTLSFNPTNSIHNDYIVVLHSYTFGLHCEAPIFLQVIVTVARLCLTSQYVCAHLCVWV